jgi:hypothetical protein
MKVNNSRKYSNIQQGHLQQQQELTTRISATAAETIGTSEPSTAEGRPATAGGQENVAMPITVLALAGTPTAQFGLQQLMSFRGNSRKSRQTGENS